MIRQGDTWVTEPAMLPERPPRTERPRSHPSSPKGNRAAVATLDSLLNENSRTRSGSLDISNPTSVLALEAMAMGKDSPEGLPLGLAAHAAQNAAHNGAHSSNSSHRPHEFMTTDEFFGDSNAGASKPRAGGSGHRTPRGAYEAPLHSWALGMAAGGGAIGVDGGDGRGYVCDSPASELSSERASERGYGGVFNEEDPFTHTNAPPSPMLMTSDPLQHRAGGCCCGSGAGYGGGGLYSSSSGGAGGSSNAGGWASSGRCGGAPSDESGSDRGGCDGRNTSSSRSRAPQTMSKDFIGSALGQFALKAAEAVGGFGMREAAPDALAQPGGGDASSAAAVGAVGELTVELMHATGLVTETQRHLANLAPLLVFALDLGDGDEARGEPLSASGAQSYVMPAGLPAGFASGVSRPAETTRLPVNQRLRLAVHDSLTQQLRLRVLIKEPLIAPDLSILAVAYLPLKELRLGMTAPKRIPLPFDGRRDPALLHLNVTLRLHVEGGREA